VRHHAGEGGRCRRKIYLPEPAAARGLQRDAGPWRRPRPLKWCHLVHEGNPERGLPTVTGVICLSDAGDGGTPDAARCTVGDRTAHRRGGGRGGGGAGAQGRNARSGLVGCGLHGLWTGRCLAAAGYAAGVAHDPDASAVEAVAGELGWDAGSLAQELACDIVCCVTPRQPFPWFEAGDLRPWLHLNMLGADGARQGRGTPAAVASCARFLRRVGASRSRR